uniref:Uncharacterized protein n=1 Tax=Phlebotomus papatasi TaxID=29031 RepID=A0A1B0DLB1_PHLPP
MNYLNPLELSCEVKQEAISCTEELCRLCAKSVTSYSSIFQDNLHEYLTLIFGVSIQQNDNWPKSICNICFEMAKNYVKYVLSVRRAETSLRSIYGELSNLEPGISFINVQEILNPEDTRDHASEGSDYNENEDENDIKVFPPGTENSFDTLEDSKIPNKITLNERQFLEESSKDNKPFFMEEYDGQTSEETEDLPTLNRRTPPTDQSTDEEEEQAETSLRSIYGELSNTPEPGISFINVQEILNPGDTRDNGIEGSDENENEDNDVNVHETESEDSIDNSEMHKIANKRKRKESHIQDAPPKGKKSALIEENNGDSCETEAVTQKKNRTRPSKSKPTQNRRVPSTDKSKEEDERIKKFFKMECSVCSNPFETYNELKSHAIKIHNDQKLAFIICCKKKLDNRTKIVNHLNHHTKPDAYKCPKPGCSKTFLTPTGLYSHQLNKHVKGKEKIKCVHCSQSFLTLYRLKSHELKHLNGNEEKQKFK